MARWNNLVGRLPEAGVEADRGVHPGTHTLATLLRYRADGIEKSPSQEVRHVVVDDEARLPERVRLPFEEINGYIAEVDVN